MAEDDKKREEESTDETREDDEGKGDVATSAATSSGAKASETAEDDDEDEGDEDEGDEEDDEEDEAPAAKEAPAPKPEPKAAKSKAPSEPIAEPARGTSPRKRAPLPPEPPPAAIGKTVTLFVVTMGALSAGFYLLGAETGGDKTAPRWKKGQTVDVNITLVSTDRTELACASETVVADRRCEFVNKTKPAEQTEDDKLLKPYTTTDNVQFLGAGLWSQPDLEVKKLPADRFTVKCKLTVEGEIKKPAIRWATRGGFSDKDNTWYTGALKECSLAP